MISKFSGLSIQVYYNQILQKKLTQMLENKRFSSCLVITLIFISIGEIRSNIIKIDYGGFQSSMQPFMQGIKNQFYVDIGAYDPYFLSLTQQLYLQGWTGVNVDAGYERIINFMKLRAGTINVNQAIDLDNAYVEMHELPDDSSSGITTTYSYSKNMLTDPKIKKTSYSVSTMTMKDLCERFYQKKPVFLTIDIEGNEGRALQSNNWSNPKCRPQLLFVQMLGQIQQNENGTKLRNGQSPVQQIMQKNNYKLILDSRPNAMYVQADKFDYYNNKAILYKKQQHTEKRIGYQSLIQQLFVQYAGFKSYYFYFHYNVQTYPICIFMGRNNEPIIISSLYQQSRSKKYKSSRPIFVFQHNPNNSLIYLGGAELQSKTYININYREKFDLHFWCIKASSTKYQQNFTVYILDHQYMEQGFELEIIGSTTDSKNKQLFCLEGQICKYKDRLQGQQAAKEKPQKQQAEELQKEMLQTQVKKLTLQKKDLVELHTKQTNEFLAKYKQKDQSQKLLVKQNDDLKLKISQLESNMIKKNQQISKLQKQSQLANSTKEPLLKKINELEDKITKFQSTNASILLDQRIEKMILLLLILILAAACIVISCKYCSLAKNMKDANNRVSQFEFSEATVGEIH